MGALLLAGILIVTPGLFNLNPYKDIISRKVKDYTGRSLTIKGNLRVSFLPTLAVKAEAITFANAPDFSSPDMVRIPELEVRVKLLPLLRGQVIIDALAMKNPVFFLEKNTKGAANWQFPLSASSGGKAAAPEMGGMKLASPFSIHQLTMTHATLHYKEGGNSMILDDLTLAAELNAISGSARLDVKMHYAGKPLSAVAKIENMESLLNGTATAGRLEGTYGERKFSLGADKLIWEGKRVALPAMTAVVDDIHTKGSVALDVTGERPVLKAVFDVGPIDVNNYMPQVSPAKRPEAPASPAQHWGDTPLNLAWVKKYNATLQLHMQAIKLRAVYIKKSNINLVLNDGVLRVSASDARLYDGVGNVTAIVDMASQPMPVVEADIAVSHMNAGQFLKEVASFKQLEGVVDTKMTLSTRGRTVKEMVSALSGKGIVSVRNGALRGMNLSLPPEKVTSLMKTVYNKEEHTAFDSASASFTIASGIVSNDDLLIHTPLTDIHGTGTIDLPNDQLHYRLIPAQTSAVLGGKKLVILVEGSINDPKMTVDVSQLIPKSKEEAKEALDAIRGLRKNKKMKEELNKLRGILDNVH